MKGSTAMILSPLEGTAQSTADRFTSCSSGIVEGAGPERPPARRDERCGMTEDPRIGLVPVDVEAEADALRGFLTVNAFPFHVRPRPTAAPVSGAAPRASVGYAVLRSDQEARPPIGALCRQPLRDRSLRFRKSCE
jgi:hypothetical protein